MKERPILFSGAMVRALLADTKTQTRRVVKPSRRYPFEFVGSGTKADPDWNDPSCWGFMSDDGDAWLLKDGTKESDVHQIPCPYGQPGDRLYVRETFYAYGRWETRYSEKKKRDEWHFVDMTLECGHAYAYAADGAPHDFHKSNQRSDRTPSWWKRPAIHMPRLASRILREIVSVRVERLNDISQADAVAEGAMVWAQELDTQIKDLPGEDAQFAFLALWESINGAGSWAANPWVWVVEFKRVTP